MSQCLKSLSLLFQSTSSIQRKTCNIAISYYYVIISIHFLYTEEDANNAKKEALSSISIHFLYTEEDNDRLCNPCIVRYFNPLPLYRGRHIYKEEFKMSSTFQSTSSIQRKTSSVYTATVTGTFQSTSSIQRKTGVIPLIFMVIYHFNPLPLYRGRQDW